MAFVDQLGGLGIRAHEQRSYFATAFLAAEFHWFFVQGITALQKELYLPGVSALLNGFEASIRVTLHQLNKGSPDDPPSPYRVLSNTLLCAAEDNGLPVHRLAFPDEPDFAANLRSEQPRIDVRIVRLRNDVCHGNVHAFIEHIEDLDEHIFVPELLKGTSASLVELAFIWTRDLAEFRSQQGLRPAEFGLPIPPPLPLVTDEEIQERAFLAEIQDDYP